MSKFKELIISKPEVLTTKQKLGSFFTFFIFWSIFLYMLRPLFILAGWGIVGYIAHKQSIQLDNIYDIFVAPILPYFVLIAVMLIIFPLWMIYNMARFRGTKNRRTKEKHRVLEERIAADMNVSPELYNEFVTSDTLLVHFDDDANIISAEELPADGRL